jgi:hypothetical protein
VAFADAVCHWPDGKLGFVRDSYMGDDPAGVKAGTQKNLRKLIHDHEFGSLLFAHGQPLIGGGKKALTDWLEELD